MGAVSSEAGDKIVNSETGKYYDSLTMLVDITVQPGNSGGPVLRLKLDGRFDLVGVITGAMPGDLAILEPLSRVREVIEHAYANPVEGISNVVWSRP